MVAVTKRVLVVDDEEIVRESYKLALTDAGYDVCTVSNGRDAIRACRSHHFDVMLADIRMPDMDGLEVSRVITREFPNVRVVMITGYPSPEYAARARRLGCVDFVEKPVGPDRLSAVTAAALAHPRVEPEEEEPVEKMDVNAALAASTPVLVVEPVLVANAEDPVMATNATARIPATAAATEDISALTALLVMLGTPLIGLAYFLLFPFIGTGIVLTVIAKEIIKIFRPASE